MDIPSILLLIKESKAKCSEFRTISALAQAPWGCPEVHFMTTSDFYHPNRL